MNAFMKGRLVYRFWVQYWFMDQMADSLCTDLSWKEGNATWYQGRENYCCSLFFSEGESKMQISMLAT